MKLNLGCGPSYKDGYVNCDKDSFLKIDKMVDVRNPLPFSNESAEIVCTENLLDSLTKEHGLKLIREIWRILVPNGTWEFIQGDVAVNPDMCFGWPFFVSGWTRNDFRHYTIGEASYENWKEPWDLPGFCYGHIEHNANGIMLGTLIKPNAIESQARTQKG